MSELNKEEQLKAIHDGIKAAQETVDLNEKSASSRFDKTDKRLDALDEEKVQRVADEVTKQIAALGVEKSKEKFEELTAKHASLESAMIDMNRGGANSSDEFQEEYKSVVGKYIRKGTHIDEDMSLDITRDYVSKNTFGADEAAVEMISKNLVAGSGPDGGYFLSTDRSSSIVKRIFETSPLRGLANTQTTTSDVWEIMLDDDEPDAGVVGEVAPRPDTGTPQVGMIKIPVHEYYAQPKATQKMIDDAGFDIEGWLSGKVSRKIGRMENTDFVSGDSSFRPKGFLTYAASAPDDYVRGQVGQLNAGHATELTANGLVSLQNLLIEDYQANATWAMNRRTFGSVMQLKGDDGQYLLNRTLLATGSTKILLGSEVTFMTDIPTIAANSLAVVYADWNEFYTIVDRFDIRVLRDPYTAKPYVRYYTTKRTGGAVTNFEAGKILKIAVTAT